jgi:XisH protein
MDKSTSREITNLRASPAPKLMPAKDLYHDAVKQALINNGWTITADPYIIRYEDAELYADLAAESPIAAQRQGQKIVVEIKSFVGRSLMYDFHAALGQYIVYRNLIQLTEPEYIVYRAIDESVYQEFFQRKSIQAIVKQNQLLLTVVDMELEEIVQWID